jgi:hypothetical protein
MHVSEATRRSQESQGSIDPMCGKVYWRKLPGSADPYASGPSYVASGALGFSRGSPDKLKIARPRNNHKGKERLLRCAMTSPRLGAFHHSRGEFCVKAKVLGAEDL